MISQRRSVFDRLGPPAAVPQLPPPPAEEQAAPPKQRVALAHPLVARHLTLAHLPQRGGAAVGSHLAPQGQAAEQQQQRQQQRQPRQQQQRQRERHRRQPPEQQQGSSAGAAKARTQRQHPGRNRNVRMGAQEELQRVEGERDAAEEMLGQMAAQTQSLLADKAALQQQAAKLEALACALQERLDFLLLEEDSQEWYAGDVLPPDAVESEQDGSHGSSAAQPSTPSATSTAPDAAAAALHGRLDGLAAESQLCAAAVGTPSSGSASGAPSTCGSPRQAAPAADFE